MIGPTGGSRRIHPCFEPERLIYSRWNVQFFLFPAGVTALSAAAFADDRIIKIVIERVTGYS